MFCDFGEEAGTSLKRISKQNIVSIHMKKVQQQ